jgi:Winged helix DNA-binding domain
VDAREVLRRRLATQRLVREPVGGGERTAPDVVRLLTGVQSQETAHALWSLGLRTPGTTLASLKAELDAGRFLRTHVLRPTWHFVAPEDLRWLLAFTAPRVQRLNATMYRKLDLGQQELDRSAAVVVELLSGANHLTRAEVGAALAARGLAGSGMRLGYVLMNAELEGLVCSGPMKGAQHTYARLDERAPDTTAAGPEDALAELTLRFFAGHGPAGRRDLARWASLRLADVDAGLDAVHDRLRNDRVGDEVLWWSPDAPCPSPTRQAFLLPLYDEVTLSYPGLGFPVAEHHPHTPGDDLFVGAVVVDETNVGTWRRTVRGRSVDVELRLAPGTTRAQGDAVDRAADRLAAFLGKSRAVTP